jgi:hypothetical protein
VTAGVFAEDELGVARANGFGGHDLVGEGMAMPCWWMQDSWAKALAPPDGLVRRAAKGDTVAEHLACGVELAQDGVDP